MANPIIEKALKLQQEADNAKQEAIQALLKQQDEISEQLKALGHGSVVAKVKAAVTGQRQSDPNKPCSVCGKSAAQLGVDRHDARSHRKENLKKQPEKKETKK